MGKQACFSRSYQDRDKWMQTDPEVFVITDHYHNYPYVLVHLDKTDPEELKKLLTESWL